LITRFDRFVLIVLGVIVAIILFVILLGDRVGVTLVRVAPLGAAGSTTTVLIQFSETMDRDSVISRIHFDPPVQGTANWTGATMIFRPATALKPGETYTVTLDKGAASDVGRQVLSAYTFNFKVTRPRVAFLAPADSAPQNIWIADQDDPQHPKQITFSPTGVFNFGVSPDGTQIAFAERNSNTGTSDIKLLDLASGGLTQLTNCQDADCTTPVWRPDGRVIAYERVEMNSNLTSVGTSPTRVWLLDLSTTPPATKPLFSDLQVLGYGPEWSADGSRIAVFNRDQGILVYDFKTSTASAVPSVSGMTGALAPDGTRLVYPELVLGDGQQQRSYLRMADLKNNTIEPLTDANDPVKDDSAEWSPDGKTLAVARQYLDNRFTRGAQIYLMNPADASVKPVTDDSRYANAFFTWDATGDQLLIQRFQELDDKGDPKTDSRPEAWTYDLTTGTLTKIATNVFHPRWVP
jgi:Tol biopolymer transport system component